MRTFKSHFGISKTTPTEFINIPLDEDLTAFICPFLIANNRHIPLANEIYAQVTAFMEKLNRDFVVPNNRAGGLIFLSHLHEPNEYHLGYSGRNKGKAIADLRAEVIYASLRNNRFARRGITITNEAHNVLLLVEGIGQDIMSDTIANVSRDLLAEFTEQQCAKHGIATTVTSVEFYDPIAATWSSKKYNLPQYKGKPIILLPNKIVSGPRAYTNRYNYFIASNYISWEIMNNKIQVKKRSKFITKLKNGGDKALVKNIYKEYRKSKGDLIDFAVQYQDSLIGFLDYAKEHYPELDIDLED